VIKKRGWSNERKRVAARRLLSGNNPTFKVRSLAVLGEVAVSDERGSPVIPNASERDRIAARGLPSGPPFSSSLLLPSLELSDTKVYGP